MATLFFSFALLCLSLHAHAQTKSLQRIEFYMHDLVDLEHPENATTALVAGPNNNVSTVSQFGSVMVIDDPLTEGPSLDSKAVGRAQGFYMSDSRSNVSLIMTFTAVFENGTLSVHGQDLALAPVRELAVIGGTGVYRLVRGYAEIRTHKFQPPSLAAILNVKVFLKVDEAH